MATITLSRAHRIEERIRAALKRTELKPTVAVSAFEADPHARIQLARADLARRAIFVGDLLAVLARIRSAVAAANVESGISALLAEKAALEETNKIVGPLVEAPAETSDPDIFSRRETARPEVVPDQAEALTEFLKATRERFRQADRGESSITILLHDPQAATAAFGPGMVARRRRIEDIGDQLRHLNAATQITVADADMEFLRTNDVV
jgi:hypothetical protein